MSNIEGLPGGWIQTTLGEITFLNPRWFSSAPDETDEVSFIPMASVEASSGKLNASQAKIWKEVSKGFTRFQEDDILFAKITPCMENGKTAIASGLLNKMGAGSTEFHVLRPTQSVIGKLILYFLLQESLRREARMQMQGAAGQLRVPPEFLERRIFLLPPLAEQHRIVAEIEKQFTRLDTAVTALKRVQGNLKRYRASVLKAACEGRLVPTEAELARAEGRDYEPADRLLERILKERRANWEADQLAKMKAQGKTPKDDKWKQKYREPAEPDLREVQTLPKGWVWASIEAVSYSLTYGITVRPKYHSEGVPLISAREIRSGKVDIRKAPKISLEDYDQLRGKCKLQLGDVLFSKTGTIGRVAQVKIDAPLSVSQNVAVISPLIMPSFLELMLRTPLIQKLSTKGIKTTAVADLQLGVLGRFPVPIPPSAEMPRIVAEVERRLSVIDEIEGVFVVNLKRAESLRQAILKRAFEGKLVPQDPNDEPASALLERIRAEREVRVIESKERLKARRMRK